MTDVGKASRRKSDRRRQQESKRARSKEREERLWNLSNLGMALVGLVAGIVVTYLFRPVSGPTVESRTIDGPFQQTIFDDRDLALPILTGEVVVFNNIDGPARTVLSIRAARTNGEPVQFDQADDVPYISSTSCESQAFSINTGSPSVVVIEPRQLLHDILGGEILNIEANPHDAYWLELNDGQRLIVEELVEYDAAEGMIDSPFSEQAREMLEACRDRLPTSQAEIAPP